MFIKDNEKLPPNVIWVEEDKAKIILEFFPEISRKVNDKGNIEIAFVDNQKIRDKLKK